MFTIKTTTFTPFHRFSLVTSTVEITFKLTFIENSYADIYIS